MPLDPTLVQPLPTGAEDATDVGHAVVEYLTSRGLDGIAKDHESRIVFGEKKYGQRLKINNGRDYLLDSLQECLDGLSYLMQGHLEGNRHCLPLFNRIADIADDIRSIMLPIDSEEKITNLEKEAVKE